MRDNSSLSDHLATAARRYGKVPTSRRTISAPRTRVLALQKLQGGLLGAAGLVWNGEGQVLLLRERDVSEGKDVWITPGGMALPGEGPEEVFLREVREEAGVEVKIIGLTCVYDLTVTDDESEARGLFFQFEGFTSESTVRPGRAVSEVRWFDELPRDMAFREDYLSVVQRRKEKFSRGTPESTFRD